MKTIHKTILWVVGLSCFCLFYHYFNPTHSQWAPKCPFWLLTGYQCPGCGSQRAIHCFLNGRMGEGIRHNYLLLPSLLYVIVLTLAPAGGRLRNAMTSSVACYLLLSMILAWWILRNLI